MDTFETLKKKHFYLKEKKWSLKLELDTIEKQLDLCTKEMYQKCIEDGGHYFCREYDYQLYGEVTLTCTNCGYTK